MAGPAVETDAQPGPARAVSRPPVAVRLLGGTAALLIGLGTTLRVETDEGLIDYSLAGDNRSTHVMAVIMVALPLVGSALGGTWARIGVGAGGALVSGAWALCAVAVTASDAPGALDRGETAPIVALYLFSAAAVAGTATFTIAALARRGADTAPKLAGRGWVLGVVSSVALVLGLMLPAGDINQRFTSRNFAIVDDPANLAWLAFVASFGVVGVVGFASRSWWGLTAVGATLVPIGWMMLVYRKTFDYPGEPGVTLVESYEVHHLVLFAAIGQALAVAVGILATANRHAFSSRR